MYQQAKGSIKDMQKWAFEILSTFLANGAVCTFYNNLKLDKNYQILSSSLNVRVTEQKNIRNLFSFIKIDVISSN